MVFVVSVFAGCNWFGSSGQTYTDAANNISFNYPKTWTVESTPDVKDAPTAVFHLGSPDTSAVEKEGWIVYGVIQNPEKLILQAYLDKGYENCLAIAAKETSEFGTSCAKTDLTKWTTFDAQEYKAYQSDWKGIPESGERIKIAYIVADGSFVNIDAIQTSKTDVAVVEKVLQDIFGSIKFK